MLRRGELRHRRAQELQISQRLRGKIELLQPRRGQLDREEVERGRMALERLHLGRTKRDMSDGFEEGEGGGTKKRDEEEKGEGTRQKKKRGAFQQLSSGTLLSRNAGLNSQASVCGKARLPAACSQARQDHKNVMYHCGTRETER